MSGGLLQQIDPESPGTTSIEYTDRIMHTQCNGATELWEDLSLGIRYFLTFCGINSIILTSADLQTIGPLGTNLSEIWFKK